MKNLVTEFFGLKNTKTLIGKIIKISFESEIDGGVQYSVYLQVSSFTLDKNVLAFPLVPYGGGLDFLQVSLFRNKEFHIATMQKGFKCSGENGEYKEFTTQKEYYYSNSKKHKSRSLSKGSVDLV